MKKLWALLTEPDEYDGVTWLDIIINGILVVGTFIGLALLIRGA
jgi:hypothetical protein